MVTFNMSDDAEKVDEVSRASRWSVIVDAWLVVNVFNFSQHVIVIFRILSKDEASYTLYTEYFVRHYVCRHLGIT